jgi:hypothetical protein
MREGQGYVIVACNTADINYLEHAYHLAVSIKDTQKINNVSVIANAPAVTELQDKHRRVFDNVIPVMIDESDTKNFTAEYRVWERSPYKQTIKIEADMLLTSNIDHWWAILDQKDIVLTNQVVTYRNDIITNRSQRKLFDDNQLPDVYSGLYFFRYSRNSQYFFNLVKQIFQNWSWFRDHYLINCRYQYPVTDEVFAIAANMFGIENCTLSGSIPSFVHMKNQLQNLPTSDPWWEYIWFEKTNTQVNVGFYKQTLPLHYNNKKFLKVLNDQTNY